MVAISAVSAGLTSLVQDLHGIPDEKMTAQRVNATMRP
jgi:hypothetical protein